MKFYFLYVEVNKVKKFDFLFCDMLVVFKVFLL